MFSRRHLFDKMQGQELDFNAKLIYIENYLLNFYDYSEEERRALTLKIAKLKTQFKQRWMSASRKVDKFLHDNNDWLQGTFEIPRPLKRPGRPQISFDESSERSKRRKTEDLRRTVSPAELSYATRIALYSSGKKDASKVLGDIMASPKRATKYRQAFYRNPKKAANRLSPLQALAMFVEADLTRKQYEIIRNTNKTLYPCYSLIQKAKRECYPAKEEYTVTETGEFVGISCFII